MSKDKRREKQQNHDHKNRAQTTKEATFALFLIGLGLRFCSIKSLFGKEVLKATWFAHEDFRGSAAIRASIRTGAHVCAAFRAFYNCHFDHAPLRTIRSEFCTARIW